MNASTVAIPTVTWRKRCLQKDINSALQQADGTGPTDEFVLGGEERSQGDEQHWMASKNQWNTTNDGEHPTMSQTDHGCGTPEMGGSHYS